MSFHKKLFDFYYQINSISTNKRLLVIESDDWGSQRTENLAQRKSLNNIGPRVQKDPYIQLDGLANEDDLSAMFETLSSVKSNDGKSPILTANICTANPDFDKIHAQQYEKFYFDPFFKTILKTKNGKTVLKLWEEGQTKGIFHPQLHGREHLHALAWLAELRNGNKELLKAFELETWGIPYKATLQQRRKNLQAALDFYSLPGEDKFQREWLKDSVNIFQNFFGYAPTTFIPPAYVWHSRINRTLQEIGVQSLQGIKIHYQPQKRGYRRKLRYMGEKDHKNQIRYFPRNVFFEPALLPNKDWYSETLMGIEKAFANKQPIIISSHRINFIGKLEECNRTQNLKTLKAILKEVVKRHPEVDFISSDKLVETL